MNRMRERVRFNKGLFAWMGFRSIGVPFDVPPRQGDGGSRWRPRQLLRFGLDGIASFTTIPLRVWSYLGLVISLFAFCYAMVFLIKTLMYGTDVPGFPTLIISVMFFAGVQLISLGVIGEYLGRMYEEVKGRPLFLVSEELGIEREAPRRQFIGPRCDAVPGEPRAQRGEFRDRTPGSMIILCADDYALTEGISRAIGELAAAQRLSATSVLVTSAHWPATRAAPAVHRGHLSVGLHLDLTLGTPLGPMPRLAPTGAFPGLRGLIARACSASSTSSEIRAEIERQLDRFELGMRASARPHRRPPARACAAGRAAGRCWRRCSGATPAGRR